MSHTHEGHTFIWNITKAWQIVEERPRACDFFRPADQGVTVEHLEERYPSLDWESAKTTDRVPSGCRPLLFVPYRGQAQMVDGWHRIARAVLEGVEELPAYLLTQAEADACLLLHLPPTGHGSRRPEVAGRRMRSRESRAVLSQFGGPTSPALECW